MSITSVFVATEVSRVLGLCKSTRFGEPPGSWRDPLSINNVECNQERHPVLTIVLHTQHVHTNIQKQKQKEKKNWLKVKDIALIDFVLYHTGKTLTLARQTRRVQTVLLR